MGGKILRHFGKNSAIYALANIMARGLNFLLVPIFTRCLTPSDYGILALAGMVSGLTTTTLSFSIEGAASQLYLLPHEGNDRRSLYGTMLAFWIVVPGTIVILIQYLGMAGRINFINGMPFNPYLKLVLWAGYFNIFITLPIVIYTTLQKSIQAMVLNLCIAILTTFLNLVFVVFLHKGVLGYLRANLIAAAVGAIIGLFLTVRVSSLDLSWEKLRAILTFSLPLVPHSAANWALSLADRFVLQRFVETKQIGLYLLGYQFGGLVMIASTSINSAFYPIANNYLSDAAQKENVPRLGTYAFLAIAYCGGVAATLGGDLILILTPLQYHPAARVVPWIACGFVFHGAYLIFSRGTFYSQKTATIPVLTIIAAVINIYINYLTIPIFGIIAAAVNTAVAYAILAVLHAWLAHRMHPIQWEYTKLIKISGIITSWVLLSFFLTSNLLGCIIKIIILIFLMPISILQAKVLPASDWTRIYHRIRNS